MPPRDPAAAHASRHAESPSSLPATARLLTEGGDARIAMERDRQANRYGCAPFPDPELLAFGSATATGISEAGFAAAERLRDRLAATGGERDIARGEFDRIRRELVELCGLSEMRGLDVVFAASGTDLHLIAAQLTAATQNQPGLAVTVDAAETGRQVPAALAGRHFSGRTPLGGMVGQGSAIPGARAVEVATVPIRTADGRPRSSAAIDGDFESLVAQASAQGRRVLLILADVSKTGCIAPSPDLVDRLKRRLADTLDVLVDACQFRISSSTLSDYLGRGFMVALTGSKFVTGPTFAAALMIPESAARSLRRYPLSGALRAYSSRADWPPDWENAALLDETVNLGLLLRWEAALQELRPFCALDAPRIAAFVEAFWRAVRRRLAASLVLESLPVPDLVRGLASEGACWDRLPTIFPFLLYRHGQTGRTPLDREQTARIYRLLQEDLSGNARITAPSDAPPVAGLRCQFGQPVDCGAEDGVLVSALRLCLSTRLVVEAVSNGGGRGEAVIGRAMAALDKVEWLLGLA